MDLVPLYEVNRALRVGDPVPRRTRDFPAKVLRSLGTFRALLEAAQTRRLGEFIPADPKAQVRLSDTRIRSRQRPSVKTSVGLEQASMERRD